MIQAWDTKHPKLRTTEDLLLPCLFAIAKKLPQNINDYGEKISKIPSLTTFQRRLILKISQYTAQTRSANIIHTFRSTLVVLDGERMKITSIPENLLSIHHLPVGLIKVINDEHIAMVLDGIGFLCLASNGSAEIVNNISNATRINIHIDEQKNQNIINLSINGKYASCQPDGDIHFNRPIAQGWERFTTP